MRHADKAWLVQAIFLVSAHVCLSYKNICEPIFLCRSVFACVFRRCRKLVRVLRASPARVSEQDWKAAISLYQKAIAADPTPESHKRYGGRTVYYPYFELGLAYLAAGNFRRRINLANKPNSTALLLKIRSKKKCLKIVTTILEKLQRPLPQSQPPREQRPIPHMQILSAIPPQTDQTAVIVEGAASSGYMASKKFDSV